MSLFAGVTYGFFSIAVAFLTLVGFQDFDLNLGTIVLSSELFFATIAGLLLFHEYPTQNEVTGSALIILAIIILNIKWKAFVPARLFHI
jgi:drug/metabolite transporter (DMT)-like permease